jgi:hypothetical protein
VDSSVQFLRDKAAQCRRLAAMIVTQSDPAVIRLEQLAAEFEAKAEALAGQPAPSIS